MASNPDNLRGPDWKDVANALQELGTETNAVITVILVGDRKNGQNCLSLTANAILTDPAVPEAECSASVKRIMRTQPDGDLSAELLFLLYDLDSAMAKKLWPSEEETA